MRLQVNTMLALYSVIEFASDPERHVPASVIAEKYDVSPHHLAKVLAELAHAGIVESVRGVGGGYRFVGECPSPDADGRDPAVRRSCAAGFAAARQRRPDAGRSGAGRGALGDRPDRPGHVQLHHAGDDAAVDRAPAGGAAGAG